MNIIVQVKNCIKAAIYQVKANIAVYSRHSGVDFIRKRKLTLPVLIRFLLCLESFLMKAILLRNRLLSNNGKNCCRQE